MCGVIPGAVGAAPRVLLFLSLGVGGFPMPETRKQLKPGVGDSAWLLVWVAVAVGYSLPVRSRGGRDVAMSFLPVGWKRLFHRTVHELGGKTCFCC